MPYQPFLLRRLLNQSLSTSFLGLDSRLWLRLLQENRFAVDPEYWPRALLVSLASAWTSVLGRVERTRFGQQIAQMPVHSPLIVLGHWRSGTSLLYRLLAMDDRFGYPNFFQTQHPHTFLTTEAWLTRLTAWMLARTRPADLMAVGYKLPAEDELALAILTGHSFRLGRVFPRRTRHYDRFLTFRTVERAQVVEWSAALRFYLQKLTLKHRRPLLLKSAPHTGRIALLLEVLPDARFVHIHRDPYEVFQSTCHEHLAAAPFSRLQRDTEPDLSDLVLERYAELYAAFFEQQPLIPAGRFHEVRFEALERDPLGTLRSIYQGLDLRGFERLEPRLEQFVREHVQLPAQRASAAG